MPGNIKGIQNRHLSSILMEQTDGILALPERT